MMDKDTLPLRGLNLEGSNQEEEHILLIWIIRWIFLKIYLFYFWPHWVFVAARAFSSCGEQGLLFLAVCGLLIAVASLVAEHGL